MDRKSFLMSLPLMGFVGKVLGAEKNKTATENTGAIDRNIFCGNTKFVLSSFTDRDGTRSWVRDVKFIGNIPEGAICNYDHKTHSARKLKKNSKRKTIGVRQGNDVQIAGLVGVYTGNESLF